jgi:hypothetical protein
VLGQIACLAALILGDLAFPFYAASICPASASPAGWIMEVNWVSIYQAALIELEQAKISGRITEAQSVGEARRVILVSSLPH